MPGSILGTVVTRVEDPDLLTGRAEFVDDLPLPGALHLVFVRSPFAHARLGAIDVSEAAAAPGVVGVFTAADLGLKPYEGLMVLNPACPRPPLARRQGSVRRRCGRGRRRRIARCRSRRGRARGRRLRPASGRDRHGSRAGTGRAAASSRRWTRISRRGCGARSTTSWRAPTSSRGPASRTSASPSCRWRAPRSRSSRASRLTICVSTQMPHGVRGARRRVLRSRLRSRCGSSRRTSAARSAASPGSRPSTSS